MTARTSDNPMLRPTKPSDACRKGDSTSWRRIANCVLTNQEMVLACGSRQSGNVSALTFPVRPLPRSHMSFAILLHETTNESYFGRWSVSALQMFCSKKGEMDESVKDHVEREGEEFICRHFPLASEANNRDCMIAACSDCDPLYDDDYLSISNEETAYTQ